MTSDAAPTPTAWRRGRLGPGSRAELDELRLRAARPGC